MKTVSVVARGINAAGNAFALVSVGFNHRVIEIDLNLQNAVGELQRTALCSALVDRGVQARVVAVDIEGAMSVVIVDQRLFLYIRTAEDGQSAGLAIGNTRPQLNFQHSAANCFQV